MALTGQELARRINSMYINIKESRKYNIGEITDDEFDFAVDEYEKQFHGEDPTQVSTGRIFFVCDLLAEYIMKKRAAAAAPPTGGRRRRSRRSRKSRKNKSSRR